MYTYLILQERADALRGHLLYLEDDVRCAVATHYDLADVPQLTNDKHDTTAHTDSRHNHNQRWSQAHDRSSVGGSHQVVGVGRAQVDCNAEDNQMQTRQHKTLDEAALQETNQTFNHTSPSTTLQQHGATTHSRKRLPLVVEKLLDDAALQDLQMLLGLAFSDVDEGRAPV